MSRAQFGDLPPEIRERIWQLTIPADEPEVCLAWPVNLDADHEGPLCAFPSRPFVVDTGFPAAMHVCHESRAVARDPKLGGVKLRPSTAAGCPVPYRAFRPDLDTMYWGGENLEAMALVADQVPEFEEVQSLAVELQWGFRHDDELAAALDVFLPALRTLSLVLPDSSSSMADDTRRGFRQPARRCKLKTLTPEEGAKVTIRPEVLMGDDHLEVDLSATGVHGEADVPLIPDGLAIARRLMEVNDFYMGGGPSIEDYEDYQGDFDDESDEDDGSDEDDESDRLKDGPILARLESDDADSTFGVENLQLLAQTFVEYQKDGSWKEVCADRTFVEFGDLVRSGPYVPHKLRPSPEEERVNDIDGEFRVIYDRVTPEGSVDAFL